MKNIKQLSTIVNSIVDNKIPTGLTSFEEIIVRDALALKKQREQHDGMVEEAQSLTIDFFK